MDCTRLFREFENKKILVLGDIMVDAYLWGDVNRISPEAPVPILGCKRRESRLGGAANVALNLKSLGAKPLLCSVVGDDANGIVLKSLLRDDFQITDQFILSDKDRSTTVKTRILSNNGQQLLRVDDETRGALSSTMEEAFYKSIAETLEKEAIDGIIFEDYDKGVLSEKLIKKVTQLANMKEIPTFADPKKENFFHYKNITLFKPNFKEFCVGLNQSIPNGDISLISSFAETFRTNTQNDYLLITLSEHGMLLSGDTHSHFPAVKRDISDVSGAGDTVISVIALCFVSGISMDKAARIANIAGGLVCEKSGVVPIDRERLLEECDKLN